MQVGQLAPSRMQHDDTPEPITCSLVIVTYNRAQWLPTCVSSARQSGIPQLEIIVVDDGSTDNTPQVATQLDPHVRYVCRPNSGVAAARNHGAREARGQYLAFLDSDDRWLPKIPHRLLQLMEQHPEVAVGFADALVGNALDGYRRRIDSIASESVWELPGRQAANGFRVLESRSFFRRLADKRQPVFIGAVILRRAVFLEAGGFDEELNGTDDWELCMRLASRYSFAYYDRPLAIHEKHAGNLSANLDHMQRESIKALGKILHTDSRLTADSRRALEKHRAELMSGWAYRAFDRGELARARRRFQAHMKTYGLHGGPLFYWCCSWFTPAQVRWLRALKRQVAQTYARRRGLLR
jgi:glycosyltransferase involved in cell wall biosynthesis